jgi:hypothetical protein
MKRVLIAVILVLSLSACANGQGMQSQRTPTNLEKPYIGTWFTGYEPDSSNRNTDMWKVDITTGITGLTLVKTLIYQNGKVVGDGKTVTTTVAYVDQLGVFWMTVGGATMNAACINRNGDFCFAGYYDGWRGFTRVKPEVSATGK